MLTLTTSIQHSPGRSLFTQDIIIDVKNPKDSTTITTTTTTAKPVRLRKFSNYILNIDNLIPVITLKVLPTIVKSYCVPQTNFWGPLLFKIMLTSGKI